MQTLKLIIIIIASSFMACQPTINPKVVQGYWKATDDAKSLLKIDEQKMSMLYDGELMEMNKYSFQENCTSCGQSEKACIIIKEAGVEACYTILEITDEKLIMNYVNGNGQPLIYTKTEAFEVPDPYLITDGAFMGIRPGDKAADHAKFLKKTTIKTGEGTFDGWDIVNGSGEKLGQAYANDTYPEFIDLLWITASGAHASRHHGVGSSFEHLKGLIDNADYELHGSEMEGRTTVSKGTISYLLDVNKWEYNVAVSDIPKETKVKAIILSTPRSPLDGKTQCYIASNNTTNTFSLELTGKGNEVTGYLTIQQPPHHTGTGKIKGIVDGNIITADYHLQIEGDNQIEELIFKIDGDNLYEAGGPLKEQGKKMVLKDKANLVFGTLYLAKPCSEIAEAISWSK